MAGYSLNVQPVQMLIEKYFVEDNICSLIINVKPELKLISNLSPIAQPCYCKYSCYAFVLLFPRWTTV